MQYIGFFEIEDTDFPTEFSFVFKKGRQFVSADAVYLFNEGKQPEFTGLVDTFVNAEDSKNGIQWQDVVTEDEWVYMNSIMLDRLV